MTHDFNKPPHVTSTEERSQKKRLPVYILVLVGVFFIAVLVYMFADNKPTAEDAPPGHPEPTAQPATPNNSTTATATDDAVATDSNTATASNR
jgi:flagellar basal body-associated protein FliL